MKKELFIKMIENIKKEDERIKKISNFLEEEIMDGWCILKDNYNQEVIKILLISIFTEEGYDDIMWWLYEDVNKVITYKNKEYNVENIDDFYNWLNEMYLTKNA